MASLEKHNQPLDSRLAKHLLRRACFHYSQELLNESEGKTPEQVLSILKKNKEFFWDWPYDVVPYGQNTSCPGETHASWLEDPSWSNSKYSCGQNRKRAIVAGWWWFNMIRQNNIYDKLTWFLFTTFTLSKDDGSGKSAHFFDYLNLLSFYSDKSIKTLAKKITFDNSMLYYLDNSDNSKTSPNENYGREFLELFTIGKGPQIGDGDYTNYTEHDVVMASKVFTGVRLKPNRDTFDSETAGSPHYPNGIPCGYIQINRHETSNKTFSHAFNNTTINGGSNENSIRQELDDFVEMIFEKDETAKNYVRKLYRMYVKSEWDDEIEQDIISPLANQLKNNGYNLIDTLETLLCSKHFFDLDDSNSNDENIGAMIKSPLQYISEIISLFKIQIPDASATPPEIGKTLDNDDELYNFYRFWHWFLHNSFFVSTGMGFFAPSTVAGYAGDYQGPMYDRAWFNSNTLLGRYNTILSFIGKSYNGDNRNGNDQIAGKFVTNTGNYYYRRIWTIFNCVSFIAENFSNPSEPKTLIEDISKLLYCELIDDDRINYFKRFLVPDSEPDYYWTAAWNDYLSSNDDTQVKLRISQLLIHMTNAPEFQTM